MLIKVTIRRPTKLAGANILEFSYCEKSCILNMKVVQPHEKEDFPG